LNILISSASDIFGDSGPFSESIICYEIVKRLAERGHQLHVFSPRIDVKEPIPNVRLHEIGGYTLFNEGKQGAQERINWWKYSLRSRLKGRILLKHIDLVHHILPSYPFHFSLLAGLPRPFILGPMPLVSKGEAAKEVSSDKETTKNGAARAKAGYVSTDRLKGLLTRVESKASAHFWTKMLHRSDNLLLQLDKVKTDIPAVSHCKSVVTYLGVDTSQFQPGKRTSSDPTILFVGSLVESKGLKYLIEAMPRIVNGFPGARLVVIGRGSGQNGFRELARTLHVEKNVLFEGFVEHGAIHSYFQQCDIFCLPTLSEAFGMVLLEAMSCAKPVVATNVGGIPEIVEHGRSGLLVPPSNSQALAEAITSLLQDADLRGKMGRHNRTLCEQRYDWDKIIDVIEEVYESHNVC